MKMTRNRREFICLLRLFASECVCIYIKQVLNDPDKLTKGALPVPNSMNFRKTSKRPLNPHPIFGKKCCAFVREIGARSAFPLPKKRNIIFRIGNDPPPIRKFSENSSNLVQVMLPYLILSLCVPTQIRRNFILTLYILSASRLFWVLNDENVIYHSRKFSMLLMLD